MCLNYNFVKDYKINIKKDFNNIVLVAQGYRKYNQFLFEHKKEIIEVKKIKSLFGNYS